MDKELIEHITDKLQQHEAPYAEGAWERFAVKKEPQKRGLVWWPYASAVAVLLLVSGMLFYGNYFNKNADNRKIEIAKTPVYQSEKAIETLGPIPNQVLRKTESKPETKIDAPSSRLIQKVDHDAATQSPTLQESPLIVSNNGSYLANIQSVSSISLSNPQDWSSTLKVTGSPIQAGKSKSDHLTFEEILARDSQIAAAQETVKGKKKEKLKPDIYVASAMGNDNKVNMNYGFSLSYPIGSKLSLSSGIAYASMSSQQDNNLNAAAIAADAAPVSMAFASKSPVQTSKNLESVNAKLTGLSIPLDIKYQLSSKIYAGIGISAVAVLTSSQQNTYNVTQVQNTIVANANGVTENRPLIVTAIENETQPQGTTQSQDFLGFYNFSFGYRQKLSNKTNIGLEPFFRVPMKGFSKDNLNLSNGGLRLKFDF